MKRLYILTTYTGTTLSYLIKKITNVPYAHVSLGLDKELTKVYSFGRKHHSNPVFAGFVREYIDAGLYKNKVNTQCRVYSIDVTDDQYDNALLLLSKFIDNKKKYKYDTLALFSLLRDNPRDDEYRYVCSQFVAYILESIGVNIFDKYYRLITPMDFYLNEHLKLEYEGLLSNYRKNLYSNDIHYNYLSSDKVC